MQSASCRSGQVSQTCTSFSRARSSCRTRFVTIIACPRAVSPWLPTSSWAWWACCCWASGSSRSSTPRNIPPWPSAIACAPFPSSPRVAACWIAMAACWSIIVRPSASFSCATIPSWSTKIFPPSPTAWAFRSTISKDDLSTTRNLPKFQPIIIKPEASDADIAFIESHRSDIPILEMISISRRRYISGGFMAHASGYVGEVSEQQIEASNGRFRPGDFAGKTGLERQYNDLLMGTDGMRRVIVNSVGKEVGRLSTQEAIPGKQIQLTIDYDLQQVAEQSLGDSARRGGRAGSAHRRSAGHGQPPDSRSQRFFRARFERRMEAPERRSAASAAESRHSGAARSRLGF